MNFITEFVPLELIYCTQENCPETYVPLLKNLILKDIRILHWEWCYEHEHYLVIDLSSDSRGLIAMNGEIIFNIKNNKLIPVTKSILSTRLKALQHVRLLLQDHDHCRMVYKEYQLLEKDLVEESVDEEEMTTIMTDHQHYSEDDASDVSDS